MRVQEIHKKSPKKGDSNKVKEEIARRRKEGEKMVKGIFEFTEAGGGSFEFMYRLYPGQNFTKIQLNHGETCEVPMDVVKLINNTKKKIRQYDNIMLPSDGVLPRRFVTESRIKFTPLEFS